MFKLDDNFLTELGLGSLPPAEKNKMLAHIYETLEMRVGMKLAEKMTNEQLDEFESFIKSNNEAGALKWLETNFPNYKQVVSEELEKLKAEIKSAAPQIVAQSNAAQPPQAQIVSSHSDAPSQNPPVTQAPQNPQNYQQQTPQQSQPQPQTQPQPAFSNYSQQNTQQATQPPASQQPQQHNPQTTHPQQTQTQHTPQPQQQIPQTNQPQQQAPQNPQNYQQQTPQQPQPQQPQQPQNTQTAQTQQNATPDGHHPILNPLPSQPAPQQPQQSQPQPQTATHSQPQPSQTQESPQPYQPPATQ